MKRVIRFSRFFIPAVIVSSALIIFGLYGYFTKGFNLGVDFQAGINQTVQLALPVASATYSEQGNAELRISDTAMTVVLSGAGSDEKTEVFDFKTYATMGDLAKALSGIPGISITIETGAETLPSTLLVPTYEGNTYLNATPMVLHRAPQNESEQFATIEQVRQALSGLGDVSVQTLQPASSQRYLIRVQDEGKDSNFAANSRAAVKSGLEAKFGVDRVVVLKTDIVGARYSENLSRKVIWLIAGTLLVILIYSAIRFKIEYAIGAVLAIIHDALIMVSFIVWTRMEFNTQSIAAILTILGYSINDTIVQFDRVREERKLRPNDKFVDVLDSALTITLGRTIITTAATLLTVLSLYFFMTGSNKDFALALLVGMISGTYSTIYIASAFVLWWNNRKDKKEKAKQQRGGQTASTAPAKPAAKGNA
ncbi:MAG: protein translocase subunit SecF [Spirochaetaceae bacterium]|nr:protein translocase subunit SecF [Spirochaetaceae bacterium]